MDSGPNVQGVHIPYGGGTLDTGFESFINEPYPTIIPFKAATEIASLHKIIEQGACSVIAFVFLGMAESRDDMQYGRISLHAASGWRASPTSNVRC